MNCAGDYDAALVTIVWPSFVNTDVKKLSNADSETKLARILISEGQ
jgi:hypothetical protein